jgi:hypothetical protein
MNFFSEYFLSNFPFLVVVKKETTGLVVDVHCPKRGDSKIILEMLENHDRLSVEFPKNECMPYRGDVIEISYRSFALPFLKPRNVVTYWSRTRSQIRAVHNSINTKSPDILLGTLLH